MSITLRSLLFAFLLVLSLLAHPARGNIPPTSFRQFLPPPFAPGAFCPGIAPCSGSGPLGGHLRFKVPILDLTDPERIRPGLHFTFSFGLWQWAELGASFYAEAVRGGPRGISGVAQGPITLWGRLSPPPLHALFSDYPDRGLFLALQVEHASATPPFDGGGRLLPQLDTVTAISEWRSSRLQATLSAAAQIGDSRRYLGGQAAAGLWIRVGKVLRLGGEALGRAGWMEGDFRVGWGALLGLSFLDREGFQGGAAYLVGDGQDLPRHTAVAQIGFSLGKGFERPPPDPTYPPLLPPLDLWGPLVKAWQTRTSPGFGPGNAWAPPIGGRLAACQVPRSLLTIWTLRACFAAAHAATEDELATLEGPPNGPVVDTGWVRPRPPGVAVRPPVRPPPSRGRDVRGGRGGRGGRTGMDTERELFAPPPGRPGPPGPRPVPTEIPSIGPYHQPARPVPPVADRLPPHLRPQDLPPALRPPVAEPAPAPPLPPAAQVAEHAAPAPSPGAQAAPGFGKYSHLPETHTVAPGRPATQAQRRIIREENARQNAGQLRSDESGQPLVRPQASRPGVRHRPDEAHIDHIDPRSQGGSNSNQNLRVLSREENLRKGAKPP